MKRMHVMTNLLLFAVLLPAAPAGSAAAGEISGEAIAKAETAADHQALAEAYDAIAADARVQAEKHRKMANAYRGKRTPKGRSAITSAAMKLHCTRLASQYEATAAEAEMLADLHRELAAEADDK